MSEYTPTTEEVAEIYYESGYMTSPEQFDRWLNAERKRVYDMTAKIERDFERERIIKLLEAQRPEMWSPDDYGTTARTVWLLETIALIKGEEQ